MVGFYFLGRVFQDLSVYFCAIFALCVQDSGFAVISAEDAIDILQGIGRFF